MEGYWIGRRFGLFQDLWPTKTLQKQAPSSLCQSWSLSFFESFFSFLGIANYYNSKVQSFANSWLNSIQNHGRHKPKKLHNDSNPKNALSFGLLLLSSHKVFLCEFMPWKTSQPTFVHWKMTKRPVLACILQSGILWILKMLQEGDKIVSDE